MKKTTIKFIGMIFLMIIFIFLMSGNIYSEICRTEKYWPDSCNLKEYNEIQCDGECYDVWSVKEGCDQWLHSKKCCSSLYHGEPVPIETDCIDYRDSGGWNIGVHEIETCGKGYNLDCLSDHINPLEVIHQTPSTSVYAGYGNLDSDINWNWCFGVGETKQSTGSKPLDKYALACPEIKYPTIDEQGEQIKASGCAYLNPNKDNDEVDNDADFCEYEFTWQEIIKPESNEELPDNAKPGCRDNYCPSCSEPMSCDLNNPEDCEYFDIIVNSDITGASITGMDVGDSKPPKYIKSCFVFKKLKCSEKNREPCPSNQDYKCCKKNWVCAKDDEQNPECCPESEPELKENPADSEDTICCREDAQEICKDSDTGDYLYCCPREGDDSTQTHCCGRANCCKDDDYCCFQILVLPGIGDILNLDFERHPFSDVCVTKNGLKWKIARDIIRIAVSRKAGSAINLPDYLIQLLSCKYTMEELESMEQACEQNPENCAEHLQEIAG